MATFQSSWLLETLFLLKHYGHISRKIMVISLQSTWLFEISWSFLQKQYSNFFYNTEIISYQTRRSFLRKRYNFLSNIVVIFKRLWSYLVKHGHFSSIIMAIWNIMVIFTNTMTISHLTLWWFLLKWSFLLKHCGHFSTRKIPQENSTRKIPVWSIFIRHLGHFSQNTMVISHQPLSS